MKRKNNTTLSTKICAVILLSSMVLSACADTQTAQKQKIPAATYMGGDNTSAEVCKSLKDAGASHVDIFQEKCKIGRQLVRSPEVESRYR